MTSGQKKLPLGPGSSGIIAIIATMLAVSHACMPFLARTLLLLAAIATFCMAAHATSSLSFDGGGYSLELEIGDTGRPVVASVTVHKPGDAQGVVLRGNFRVKAFDIRRQELVLVYGGGDERVAPFTLTVHGNRATLDVARTRIRDAFRWSM